MYDEILLNNKYKITKPRKLMIDFLVHQKEPRNVLDIFKGLNKKIDLATVYRVLDLFEELNIVFKDEIKDKAYYYISKKKHHHIICGSCARKKCIPCNHDLLKIHGYSKIKHQLILEGVCSKCSSKK